MGLFKKSLGDEKINELCGGFVCNDAFKYRASRFKSTDWLSNTYEKSILKNEYENGTLAIEDMENRLDELLQLDCKSLDTKIRIKFNMDTSQFRIQDDIDSFLGDEYARKYARKLEKDKIKHNSQFEKDERHKLEAIEKKDIFRGVKAYVEYPSSGVKLKNQFFTPKNGNATVRVVDDGVIFNDKNSEILVGNDSIISVGDGKSYKLNLNLIYNQFIAIQFDLAGILFVPEDKGYVEEYFMHVVNSQACGDEFESLASECPECGMVNGINRSFCINCGRQLR